MPHSRRSERPRAPRPPPTSGVRRYASGVPWEARVGYSRAVRVGSRIYVSGTTATDEHGAIVGRDDPYVQTVRALDNIERALTALDARMADVRRIRIYVRDFADFDAIARALSERFDRIRPAATMVAVAALVDPAMKVEIEADADEGPRAGPAAKGSARVHRAGGVGRAELPRGGSLRHV